MSRPNPSRRPDELEVAANDILTPEQQAAVDAEHATTGWSAYDVWRSRVLAPMKNGYNKPRGNS